MSRPRSGESQLWGAFFKVRLPPVPDRSGPSLVRARQRIQFGDRDLLFQAVTRSGWVMRSYTLRVVGMVRMG